ncbi:MAG: ORC1-type DNA replication protein [Candidatus Methanomethylicia archaeon]
MSDKLSLIFKKALTSKIFKNREILRPDYIPDELPHRDEQITKLAEILAPALRGYRPSNVFIYGKPGTGKTAVTKYVLRRLVSEAININSIVRDIYVNCRDRCTNYSVLEGICLGLGKEVPFTGLSIPELFRRTLLALESIEGLAILILDEVDSLIKKSGDDILYQLTRTNTNLRKSKLSIIGITNDLKFMEYLDSRIRSGLGEEEILFPPYNAMELENILSKRALSAFYEGVLSSSVIPLCAALAARDYGDCRRALDLLRISGEIAERENSPIVEEKHVRMAQIESEHDKVVEGIATLPLHTKLVLIAIYLIEKSKKNVTITTGEVYNVYKNLCKKISFDFVTQRRVSDLINELDTLGLINSKLISMGRYGRTKIIKLAVEERSLKEALKDDVRLQSIISQLTDL